MNNEHNKDFFIQWLIVGCWGSKCENGPAHNDDEEIEYEGYDGFYNNLAQPDLGAIGNVMHLYIIQIYKIRLNLIRNIQFYM